MHTPERQFASLSSHSVRWYLAQQSVVINNTLQHQFSQSQCVQLSQRARALSSCLRDMHQARSQAGLLGAPTCWHRLPSPLLLLCADHAAGSVSGVGEETGSRAAAGEGLRFESEGVGSFSGEGSGGVGGGGGEGRSRESTRESALKSTTLLRLPSTGSWESISSGTGALSLSGAAPDALCSFAMHWLHSFQSHDRGGAACHAQPLACGAHVCTLSSHASLRGISHGTPAEQYALRVGSLHVKPFWMGSSGMLQVQYTVPVNAVSMHGSRLALGPARTTRLYATNVSGSTSDRIVWPQLFSSVLWRTRRSP
jgi:hypothetical protein